jgi:hypothetical protein
MNKMDRLLAKRRGEKIFPGIPAEPDTFVRNMIFKSEAWKNEEIVTNVDEHLKGLAVTPEGQELSPRTLMELIGLNKLDAADEEEGDVGEL